MINYTIFIYYLLEVFSLRDIEGVFLCNLSRHENQRLNEYNFTDKFSVNLIEIKS